MWNLEASVSCKYRGGSGLGVGEGQWGDPEQSKGQAEWVAGDSSVRCRGGQMGWEAFTGRKVALEAGRGKEEREGAAAVGGEGKRQGKGGPHSPGEGSCCKRGCGAGFLHPGAGGCPREQHSQVRPEKNRLEKG